MEEEIKDAVLMDAEVQIKFVIHNVCTKEDLKGEKPEFFRAMVKELIQEEGIHGLIDNEHEVLSINACNVRREKIIK